MRRCTSWLVVLGVTVAGSFYATEVAAERYYLDSNQSIAVYAAGGFVASPCIEPCVWRLSGSVEVDGANTELVLDPRKWQFRDAAHPEDYMLVALSELTESESIPVEEEVPELLEDFVRLTGDLLGGQEAFQVLAELSRIWPGPSFPWRAASLDEATLNFAGVFDDRASDGNGAGLILVGYSEATLDCDANGTLEFSDITCHDNHRQTITTLEAIGSQPGDLDGNATVDFKDFLVLSSNYGSEGSYLDGDIDGDGQVAFPDFLSLSEVFGSEARTAPVPEPEAPLCVWLIAIMLFLRRRWSQLQPARTC